MVYALGKFIFRHRWPTLIIAGLPLLLALVALSLGGKLTGGTVKRLEAERADAMVASVAGRSAANTFVALFRSQTLAPGTPEFERPRSSKRETAGEVVSVRDGREVFWVKVS